jgi:outer membrane lipoprotein-sorting protein
MKRYALLSWLLILAAPLAAAEPQTAQEIEQCVRANQPESSSIQTIAFRAKDRIGAVTESGAKIYWQKGDDGLSRLMMRFAEPADLRGAGLLLLEKKNERRHMFMYLPELKRVKRITSRMMTGSMFGTDFTYEDFERFQGFEEDEGLERLDDADLDGKKMFVIVHRPAADVDSAYERIVKYVDRKTCVPLKTEFYERGDRIRKVALSDPEHVTREGDGWIPRHTTLRDLRDETETDLIISEIEVNVEIHRKMFSERELEAGARH